MDGEHALELGERDVEERRLMAVAGIVDEKRDRTETRRDVGDQPGHGCRIGDVGGKCLGRAPGLCDRIDGLRTGLGLQVIDGDPIALGGEPRCDARADARSGAGDECGLAAHASASWPLKAWPLRTARSIRSA